MKVKRIMDGRERLYRIIHEVAATGKPMPTNDQLCDMLGCTSIATPARLLGQLEAEGRVQVTRYQAARAVFVPAIGKSAMSAKAGKTPHWLFRDQKAVQHRAVTAAAPRPVVVATVEPVRINRDPCFYCGVRGDIGCVHQPRVAEAA